MVKVFTTNKNGKVEFTEKELENLLNEVWRDGYNSNTNRYWWYSPTITTGTITTPNIVRGGYTTVSTNGSAITYTTNTERSDT